MAQHKSAEKANRQSIKRQTRNNGIRAACFTQKKKLLEALGSKKKNKENLTGLFDAYQSSLMSATQKGVYKPKTTSRQIGRMNKAVHQALGS